MSFTQVTSEDLALVEADPDCADEVLDAAYEREKKDGCPDGYIDKSYAGLDFLFRAAKTPVELDDEYDSIDDDGYLFVWDEHTVAMTAQHLNSISFDDLARQYDPATMTARDVYPSITWMRDGDDALDWLRVNFEALRAFFDDAATRGRAAIKQVC